MASRISKHFVLIAFSALAIFPVLLIIINSFKTRNAVFSQPYSLPNSGSFSLAGYNTVFARADFLRYYGNSFIILAFSMLFILLFASMVAFALSQYNFKLKKFVTVYFLLGLILPIRLASGEMLKIMVWLKLTNTYLGLILAYLVQGLPFTIFILTQFMRTVPQAIFEAARIEGANEFQLYLLALPQVKGAIATVAAFSLLPIWNDIWFPIILAPNGRIITVTLGLQQFFGQFQSDWSALLSALTLAIVPLLILYFIFSKSIISGVVEGALKQ